MGMERTHIKKQKSTSGFILVFILALLLINAFKFTNTEGNNHPLFCNLFNMIILIIFLILFYHGNDILEEKNNLWKQVKLDGYFKKTN